MICYNEVTYSNLIPVKSSPLEHFEVLNDDMIMMIALVLGSHVFALYCYITDCYHHITYGKLACYHMHLDSILLVMVMIKHAC